VSKERLTSAKNDRITKKRKGLQLIDAHEEEKVLMKKHSVL
jgi:hypothetical protein